MMTKKCTTVNPECNQIFIRFEEKMDVMNKNLESHYKGSDDRRNKMNQLSTDVAVIKSYLEDKEKNQKKIDEINEKHDTRERWKQGFFYAGLSSLLTGILMLIITRAFF